MIYPKKTENTICSWFLTLLRCATNLNGNRFIEFHVITVFYVCRRYVHGFITDPVKQFNNTSGIDMYGIKADKLID